MLKFMNYDAMTCRKAVEQIDTQLNWSWLPELADWVLAQAQAIQQIPAPTFQEADRAEYVRRQFIAFDLESVEVDDLYNVYGYLPGEAPQAGAVMVVAHTDTVFPADTDLTARRNGDRLYGPGIGDNSLGVAGLLGMLKAVRLAGTTPRDGIWFVATSREEGLGDLSGMRQAYHRLKDRIHAVINLEGMAFGHIYHAGIAVRRLHITAKTDGGHSWAHFGRPSAIHSLMHLGAQITSIAPPDAPRTTYNIGIVEGGRSINTIAAQAGMWLDMRSESTQGLESIEHTVRAYIDAGTTSDVQFLTSVVGDRPAGDIPATHPLVTTAKHALERVQTRSKLATGSTDGNISLAGGTPTITLGVSRGGNAHRLDEYIDIKPLKHGVRQLILTLGAVIGLPT
jgi:tripeptide aminopeptidase